MRDAAERTSRKRAAVLTVLLRMRHALAGLLLLLAACSSPPPLDVAMLQGIDLPPGFRITIWAKNVPNARSLCVTPGGTVFVGNRKGDKVFALRDEDGNGAAERMWTIASGLDTPNGVAFKDGALYVAEIRRVLRYDAIENNLDAPPAPVVVTDAYPTDTHHGWKFIRFGPDGALYVPVGAPCNVCLEPDPYASITKLDVATGKFEVVARGIRNTVGFDWHPATRELWFTDNGRDWMGDDGPPDELNHAPRAGLHFGFPFLHGLAHQDPDFWAKRDASAVAFTPPVRELGPHVAALGMRFYTGSMFPARYRNQVFIAEHGSWNRSEAIGYRVMLVRLEGDRAVSYEPFATGWLRNGEVAGRPVDVEVLRDGSMLVSDDLQGAVYRIAYVGQ